MPNDFDELLNQLNTILEDESLDSFAREKRIQLIKNKIDSELAKMVEVYYKTKLGKDDLDVMDVINHFNTLDLPILDENDVRKQCSGIELPQRSSAYSTQSIGKVTILGTRLDDDLGVMEKILNDYLDKMYNELIQKEDR